MFYTPINTNIHGIPVFVCIDEGTEDVLERKIEDINQHLTKIISLSRGGKLNAEYYVIFLRKNEDSLMSDIRAHDQVEKRWSGPLVDVHIYNNYMRETSMWIWSGNTLRALWQIEQRRLQCKQDKINFFTTTPVLDEEMLLWKSFVM